MKSIQEISPLVEDYYAGLAGDAAFQVLYDGWQDIQEEEIGSVLQQKLDRSRRVEIDRGSTQVGPHRDDLLLLLGGRNAGQFASQGQRRAAALALRLAESRYLLQQVGQHPILLIDDVVYEMDNPRRSRFWQYVDVECQLIVTATDREHLGAGLEPAQVFQVENGTISLNGT